MIEKASPETYLRALKAGRALEFLKLGEVNGRRDMRGLSLQAPRVSRARDGLLGTLEPNVFSDVRLQRIDFSGSELPSFRFTGCHIQDVVFDNCACRDWRLWTTSVSSTTFRGADLRGAVLGALLNAKANSFHDVCFDGADLRGTAYASADFIDCTFRNCRLDGVEFGGSRFVNCVFEGELSDVIFARHGFGAEKRPPNEMRNVDFTRAQFKFVNFRELDLKEVAWPNSSDHIVIDDFPEMLDHLIALFGTRTTSYARGFVGLFQNYRKWLGKDQRKGVITRREIVEVAGEAAWEELLEALACFRG